MTSVAPKVSKEEREAQIERLYAGIGKIAALGEHLNEAMNRCCCQVLEFKGLPQPYAQTVLIGQNLENMRRTWESLMKLHYTDDPDAVSMISHVSDKIDNVVRRRNDTVHRLWFIGWGNEQTETYEVADGMKAARDIGKKRQGGVRFTATDSKDFQEIIEEIERLTKLVRRFGLCVVMPGFKPGTGKPKENFHFDNGVLKEGAAKPAS